MGAALDALREAIRRNVRDGVRRSASLPEFTRDPIGYSCRTFECDDFDRFLDGTIDRLLSEGHERHDGVDRDDRIGDAADTGITFLCDLRSIASVGSGPGTFAGMFVWLPFLLNALRVSRIVFLPLCPIGRTRRKGRSGSLFAVTDHAGIDSRRGDPALTDVPVGVQYRALAELAAARGIRVGSVQPMMTAALDAPIFAEHSELTYWWAADPGEVLRATRPRAADAMHLSSSRWDTAAAEHPPGREFVARFVDPPHRSSLRTIDRPEGRYLVGRSMYRGRMTDVSIANALPDVIPQTGDDHAWSDVALLNYTGRRVPLAHPEPDPGEPDSRALSVMSGILNNRARTYGETVFWLDMARSLPAGLRESATEGALGFAPQLIHETVEGVSVSPDWPPGHCVGDFLYSVVPRKGGIREHAGRLAEFVGALHIADGRAGVYLAGPGTHDTLPLPPRLAATFWVLAFLLPGAVPLLYSGQERYWQGVSNFEFGIRDEGPPAVNDCSLFSHTPEMAWAGIDAGALAREYDLPPFVTLTDDLRRIRRQTRDRLATVRAARFHELDGTAGISCSTAAVSVIDNAGRGYGIVLTMSDSPSRTITWPFRRAILRPVLRARKPDPVVIERGGELCTNGVDAVPFTWSE